MKISIVLTQVLQTAVRCIGTLHEFAKGADAAGFLLSIGAGLGIYCLYLLLKIKPQAIKWTLISMLFPVALALMALMNSQSDEIVKSLFQSVGYATLWGAYLLSSKRVKNTFAGSSVL